MTEFTINELIEHPEFKENEYWHRKSFSSGESIFKQDDPGEELYLVLNGKVQISYNVKLDDSRNIKPGISEIEQGNIFGEMSMIDHSPRSASASAATDSELAVINCVKFQEFLDKHPEVEHHVLRYFYAIATNRLKASTKQFGGTFAWGLKAHGIKEHL